MKLKIIITVFLLVLPLAIAPVGVSAQVAPAQESVRITSTEMVTPNFATADDAYLSQWKNLRDSFERPSVDYEINHAGFEANSAIDFLLEDSGTDFDLQSSSIGIDAKPCDSSLCLKDSKGIVIDEPKDLRRLDGTGTIDDPYLITGLRIADDRQNNLQISNVNGYFLVYQNSFEGSSDASLANIVLSNIGNGGVTITGNNLTNNAIGIIASNVDTLNIVNNNIFGHTADSITATGSFDVTVSNNIISGNGQGVVYDGTSGGSIDNNQIFNNLGNGVTLSYSNGITIDNNAIYSNAQDGIFFQDSDNNVVSNNDIYANGPGVASVAPQSLEVLSFVDGKITFDASFAGAGLWFDPSYDNVVKNNNIHDNAGTGMTIELSDRSTIDGNTVTGNGYSGIFFIDTHDSAVTNNMVSGNGVSPSLSASLNSLTPFDYVTLASFAGSGLWFDPSFRNTVSGNTVSNNFGEGIFMEYSEFFSIDNNVISDNALNGIAFLDSDDNSVTNNQISGNGAVVSSIVANSAFSPMEAKLFASFAGAGLWFDPSHRNVAENNVLMSNEGPGIFLDHSTTTNVTGNQILSNGGDGVMLVNSSSNRITTNLIDSNGYSSAALFANGLTASDLKLYASFAGSGLWFDPSPNNYVADNVITNSAAAGIYFWDTNNSVIEWNTIANSGASGIFFQDSSYNAVNYNVIEDNAFPITAMAASLDASFAGAGLWFDPSHFNDVIGNNVSGSAGDGFFSEASTNTYLEFNRFIENAGYGINFDANSSSSTVVDSNFDNNDGTASQGRDDGFGNVVQSNFWSDGNNLDANYDGIADDPYELDGNAGTADGVPSNIPEGLNFYTAFAESSPRKLNADSEGSPLTFKVTLDDGYRVLSVDMSRMWLNGTINPTEYHIVDILTFTVTFDRQAVNALVNSLGLEPSYYVHFEVVGRINDGLLELTFGDDVLIHQDEDTIVLVLGLSGSIALPVVGVKNESKFRKIINKIRNSFFKDE